jgi:hypothetical protein
LIRGSSRSGLVAGAAAPFGVMIHLRPFPALQPDWESRESSGAGHVLDLPRSNWLPPRHAMGTSQSDAAGFDV